MSRVTKCTKSGMVVVENSRESSSEREDLKAIRVHKVNKVDKSNVANRQLTRLPNDATTVLKRVENVKEVNGVDKGNRQLTRLPNDDTTVLERVDDVEELGDTVTGVFRFQNQKCMLTYRGWLDKEKYKKWLTGKRGEKSVKVIEIAHETGDKSNPYKHSHVLIDFGSVHQTKSATWFDYNGVHPHIRLVKTKLHWENNCKYLAKEDVECAHLAKKEDKFSVEAVVACTTEFEAITRFVKRPTDYQGVKSIYRDHRGKRPISDKVTLMANVEMKDWQRAFQRITKQGSSDRTINWLYDPYGKSGKTVWSQHMTDNGNGWCVISTVGREADFNHNLSNAISEGWSGQGLILDLPRTCDRKNYIYTCLEGAINGRITATKYTGGFIDVGKPHVWVFANFGPDVERMSQDRWRVLEVGRGGKGCALLVHNGKEMVRTKIPSGIVSHSFIPKCTSSSSCSFEGFHVDDSDE